MGNIQLLVVDECHHAHGNHPACITMADFYSTSPPLERPKVFGMTASPISSGAGGTATGLGRRTKVAIAMRALEATLDSRIVTVQNRCESKPAGEGCCFSRMPANKQL